MKRGWWYALGIAVALFVVGQILQAVAALLRLLGG